MENIQVSNSRILNCVRPEGAWETGCASASLELKQGSLGSAGGSVWIHLVDQVEFPWHLILVSVVSQPANSGVC